MYAITGMESENAWSESYEKTPEANGIRLHTLLLVRKVLGYFVSAVHLVSNTDE
jgi:hypothetical protein